MRIANPYNKKARIKKSEPTGIPQNIPENGTQRQTSEHPRERDKAAVSAPVIALAFLYSSIQKAKK